MTAFWSTHQVGGPYQTLEESRQALSERALLYPTLEALMPTTFRGKTILDYGCGPGHDTILFLERGAEHVYYYDISELAVEITQTRLELHGLSERASFVSSYLLPEVDHVHCAGVVHHTVDPFSVLEHLRSAVRSGGDARVMVYDGDISTHTQSEVPITIWWTRREFEMLTHLTGFNCTYVGSYPCSAPWRPDCFAACYVLT